jgi:hypothetical protein
VHLLYPGLDALTDPEKAKEFSRDHQYDIVFLHGGTSTLASFRFRFRFVSVFVQLLFFALSLYDDTDRRRRLLV